MPSSIAMRAGILLLAATCGTVAQPKPVLQLTGHTAEVYCVAWSADGRRLASCSPREVIVWDSATGQALVTSPLKGSNVYGLAFSRDGQRVAVGVAKLAHIFDATTGKELRVINTSPHNLFRLAFSPDGKQLASACGPSSNSGDVRVWEVETGKELRVLLGHADAALNVAYSDDGRFLVSSGGSVMATKAGEVQIWDAQTGRLRRSLLGHEDNVYGLAVTADGRRVASASGTRNHGKAGELKIWEVVSRREIRIVSGHSNTIYSVVFDPTGHLLATAGHDRFVKIWDAMSGTELRKIEANTGPVYTVSFGPDGQRLASGGQDRMVKIWAVAPPPPLEGPKLKPTDLERHWTTMTDADPSKAYPSLLALATAPDVAVPFLDARLKPSPRLTSDQRLQAVQWLEDLDADRYAKRDKATRSIARLGETALPLLLVEYARTPSAEVRHRLGRLLEAVAEPMASPEYLAALRAIEALERIGSPAARDVLKKLADGLPEAHLTREAAASLSRLAARP